METMLRIGFLALLALGCASAADWGPLQFLVGDWVGAGGGGPGQGSGDFSFTPELQGKILVRRSSADYPATRDKPAYRHDDLMIVYRESPAADLRADFFDNEGHVIRYLVQPSNDKQVVFVTPPGSAGPRFRLTYKGAADTLAGKFEIAPPGKDFATYLEWTARRK